VQIGAGPDEGTGVTLYILLHRQPALHGALIGPVSIEGVFKTEEAAMAAKPGVDELMRRRGLFDVLTAEVEG
jgi:hypothetical protein